MVLQWILLAILLSITNDSRAASVVDYLDNDLAKVCRPLDRQLDLLFILDGSGSVSGSTFATQMDMLNKIIDMVEIGADKTQVAVLQYSSYTRVEFNFSANGDKSSLRNSLRNIQMISGTTRTGLALEKALLLFRDDETSGARRDIENVAQVAVVVSDGHSHDDPVPAAQRLRQNGVQILTLGIGKHINLYELVQITGDESMAFQNESLSNFINAFRKIAVGEHCDFAKGKQGAEIICHADSVELNVLTTKPFYGHMYVSGQFNKENATGCVARSDNTSSTSITLRLDLMSCGIRRQFLVSLYNRIKYPGVLFFNQPQFLNPRGILFVTDVILKYHPDYNTVKDGIFGVQCFYPDKNYQPKPIKTPTHVLPTDSLALSGVKTSNATIKSYLSGPQLPCTYRLMSKSNECQLEDVRIGDMFVHRWECDKSMLDTSYALFVHSCSLISVNGRSRDLPIIDENGCSLDNNLISTPYYPDFLVAQTAGFAVKYPDSPLVQMRCSIRLCNRRNGDCNELLPPRCLLLRPKRQAELASGSMFDSLFARPHFVQRPSLAGIPQNIRSHDITATNSSTTTAHTTSPLLITFGSVINRDRRPVPPPRRRPIPSSFKTQDDSIAKAIDWSASKQARKPPPPRQIVEQIRRLPTDITLTAPHVEIVNNAPSLIDRSFLLPKSHQAMTDSEEAIIDPFESIGSDGTIIDEQQLDLNAVQNDHDDYNSAEQIESSVSIAEINDEKWKHIDLADRVMSAVSFGEMQLESQVINVHDLETFRNSISSSTTNRWCIRN